VTGYGLEVPEIDTLNVNEIEATLSIGMLEDFLCARDIDLLCLQEVTSTNIKEIRNYTAHLNTGAEGRGKAILVKDDCKLSNIRYMPSGRGMTFNFSGVRIVNIYAPSGAERRREREDI
jgi:exonuclease III